MWKLNDIALSTYGIIPGIINGEGIAVKGIFDLPKRIGITYKDWDDENSVQPYVDTDEIFLEGRTISFNGVLTGTKAETEAYITALKTAIGNFVSVVPFETPYGSYCVYIEKITAKIYNNVATIDIDFREPVIGATCSVGGTVTTYLSEIRSGVATKNNCAVGYYGSPITLYSAAGQFTSTISVAAANELADAWILENKQNYANSATTGGFCTINPPIYYNEEQIAYRTRDNCGVGYSGSVVSYTVLADTYSIDSRLDPTASTAKANLLAQAEITAIFTQAYANERGFCSLDPTMYQLFNYLYVAGTNNYRRQYIQIGPSVPSGTYYNIMIYGVIVQYMSVSGDSKSDVVANLMSLINAVTLAQWQANNQAPSNMNLFTKPEASFNPEASHDLILDILMNGEATFWIGQNPPWWDTLQA